MELRGIIVPFAKNKTRATRLYIENLEKQLAQLDIAILNYTGSQMDLVSIQSQPDKLKKECNTCMIKEARVQYQN